MLDLRTLALAAMMSGLVFFVATLALWRLVPLERSLRDWTVGALLMAVGNLLLGLRGIIPDFASIVVANAAVVLSLGFMYVGTRKLVGMAPGRPWHWLAAGAALVSCVVFTYVVPSVPMRVVLMSALYFPLGLACGWLFWHQDEAPTKAIDRLTALIFFGGAFLVVTRAIAATSLPLSTAYVSTPSWFVAAPYFYSTLLNVWMAIMLTLKVSARLQRQLAEVHSNRLRTTEAELRESEQRLTLAADAARLGIWIRDLGQDEIWASGQWRALFGFTPSQRLTLAQVLQRVHPADRRMVSQTFGQPRCEAGASEAAFRIELPDGELRWIVSLERVEFDAAGQPILIRGVSRDITVSKQAELEIEQKRMEVMHLARAAMLGELSGALAHELNQPLTAILSNAQAAQRFLAHDEVDFDELHAILQDIVDEDKRAGEVIRRLRQLFAKGETLSERVDVNALVLEVFHLLRKDLTNQAVTFQMDLAPELPAAKADRVQLEQVLINLVTNACDAMQSLATPLRLIVVRTAVGADQSILVSVIDQGSGVPAGDLEQVFQSFYTTKERGMGLGLSICRNIVSANGGRLWGENNPDRGASFHFSVPLHAAEAT